VPPALGGAPGADPLRVRWQGVEGRGEGPVGGCEGTVGTVESPFAREAAVPLVACPQCGEDEELAGERDGETIILTCGSCGTAWDRDTRLVCLLCGSEEIEGIPTSTLEEAGRGDQRTPSGIRLVYYCFSCQSDDVRSSSPRPGPQPPPGNTRDLRALRRSSR
jgi:hypothetical protein